MLGDVGWIQMNLVDVLDVDVGWGLRLTIATILSKTALIQKNRKSIIDSRKK